MDIHPHLLNADEQAVASVVAGLSGKRDRTNGGGGDSPDAAGGMMIHNKRSRLEETHVEQQPEAPPVAAAAPVVVAAAAVQEQAPPPRPAPPQQQPPPQQNPEDLKPYPFYFYKDFSTEKDPDSLTPLTAPGRVPNFPAKMHAILSRADLADVIAWMPHGRSWKVLKPREFEVRVIPTYFEHAKFSSFIRQANGWGFRRITTGRDRNSYYHPRFLRGMPFLCKDMKRPGVNKKLAADPDHEPDLYKISEMLPVPEQAPDETVLLQCTVQGGPKARMPIYSGSLSFTSSLSMPLPEIKLPPAESKKTAAASLLTSAAPASNALQLTPHDQEALSAFSTSLVSSNLHQQTPKTAPETTAAAPAMDFNFAAPQGVTNTTATAPSSGSTAAATTTPSATDGGAAGVMTLPANSMAAGSQKVSTLAAANQLAFAAPASADSGSNPFAAAFQASTAATQFAAGFAAATALNHQQLQSMMKSFQQQQEQQPKSSS